MFWEITDFAYCKKCWKEVPFGTLSDNGYCEECEEDGQIQES